MLAVGPQAHNIGDFLHGMSQADRPAWGGDTLPSQRVPQKILKKSVSLYYMLSFACASYSQGDSQYEALPIHQTF